jgi:hypothetical protein
MSTEQLAPICAIEELTKAFPTTAAQRRLNNIAQR